MFVCELGNLTAELLNHLLLDLSKSDELNAK